MLSYCSVMLKRRNKEHEPLEVELAEIPIPLSTERLELVFDCLASFERVPEKLVSGMIDKLIEHQLEVHSGPLIRFLAKDHRLEQLILRTRDSPLVAKSVKKADLILCYVRTGAYPLTFEEAVKQLTNAIEVKSPAVFDMCSTCLERLYKWQFNINAISPTFSHQYLMLQVETIDFTEIGAVTSLTKEWMLYASYQPFMNDIAVVEFVKALLGKSIGLKQKISELVCNSVQKVIELHPKIRNSVVQEFEATERNITIQLRQSLPRKMKENLKDMLEALQNVKKSLKKIESKPPSFPEDLLAQVKEYIEYIQKHFSNPDVEKMEQIIETCRKNAQNFHWQEVNPEDFAGKDYPQYVLFNSIASNLETLKIKEAKWFEKGNDPILFEQMWIGHAQFLERIFDCSDIMAIVSQPRVDLMLRIFITAVLSESFYVKDDFAIASERNKMYMKTMRKVAQVHYFGFSKPTKSENGLIIRVLESVCLMEAFQRLSLSSKIFPMLKKRFYFADLDKGVFGWSAPLGGFIVLNSKLRKLLQETQCLLMITIAHEAVHMARRLSMSDRKVDEMHAVVPDDISIESTGQEKATMNTLNCSPPTQMKKGMPGDSQLQVTEKRREGGEELEEILFGALVEKLSRAQMDFLCEEDSWLKPLEVFKNEFQALRGESDIHHIFRAKTTVHHLNRKIECLVHGL